MNDAELDAALLKAHAKSDVAQLIALYQQAGQRNLDQGDVNAGCFYLTHAYIFALEAGVPEANALRKILISYNREE